MHEMQIAAHQDCPVVNEEYMLDTLLQLGGAHVLELGCGKADKTRLIAGKAASVLALEVDEIQLALNRDAPKPHNVVFAHGGAEKIAAEDASFDIVLMFKSLHHVPVELMDDAMTEIARILKPGGVAYISEPIFAGEFNDILRIFHDEQQVREAAFAAVKRAVASGLLTLVRQHFFMQPVHFDDFGQFETQVLKVTHTDHRLTSEQLDEVCSRFNGHMNRNGVDFQMPMRIDLLRKRALTL